MPSSASSSPPTDAMASRAGARRFQLGPEALAKLVSAVRSQSPTKATLNAAIVPFRSEREVDAQAIVRSEALSELLQLLASDCPVVEQVAAACAVKLLGASKSIRATLSAAGTIPLLVTLLQSDETFVQWSAARALAYLVVDDVACAQAVEADVIPPLVSLLRSHKTDVQTAAAAMLYQLAHADSLETRERIAEAGAIPLLVALLESSRAGEHEAVAMLAEAGAMSPLVSALLPRKPRSRQEMAALVLAELALSHASRSAEVVDAGGVAPLVSMLQAGETREQLAAARALCGMAQDGCALKDELAEGGAIPPLVSLLGSHDSVRLQRQAAWALDALAADNDLRAPIIEAGALPPLVAMLRSANEDAQLAAASILRRLADRDREADDNESSPPLEAGCNAHFVEVGAIPPLVAMLQSADERGQAAAARAISELAWWDAECHAPLMHAGVCEALVPLLRMHDAPSTSASPPPEIPPRVVWAAAAVCSLLEPRGEDPVAPEQCAEIARTPGMVAALQHLAHRAREADRDDGTSSTSDGSCCAGNAMGYATTALAQLFEGSEDVRRAALLSAGKAYAQVVEREAALRCSHERLRALGDAVGAPSRQHDVVLRCADGTEVGASRLLLEQHSRYYERQLGGGLAEGSQREVQADPDFSSAAHEALLRQLHSAGVAPLPTEPSVVLELLRLANKLQPPPAAGSKERPDACAEGDVLKVVVRRCEDALLAELDVDNCLDLLRHAKGMSGCERLASGVRELVRRHIKQIIQQQQWAAFRRDDPIEACALLEAVAVDMAEVIERSSAKRQRIL